MCKDTVAAAKHVAEDSASESDEAERRSTETAWHTEKSTVKVSPWLTQVVQAVVEDWKTTPAESIKG